MDSLLTLILDGNRIGGIACKYLIKGEWPDLKKMSLGQNNINSQACIELKKMKSWYKIEFLNLGIDFSNIRQQQYEILCMHAFGRRIMALAKKSSHQYLSF